MNHDCKTGRKRIIGMCHLLPMPGDLFYNSTLGISTIIARAKQEIEIYQNNGISEMLFSNEYSYPYSKKLSQVTIATMARIIGELKDEIHIPFGVDCMYDSIATFDLAVATEANFYRVTVPKSIAHTDFEYGYSTLDSLTRHIMSINTSNAPKLLLNITPILNDSLSKEELKILISDVSTQLRPSAICASADTIKMLFGKNAMNTSSEKDFELLCDGGCNIDNIHFLNNCTEGMIVGKAFKESGVLSNSVDEKRVISFVKEMKKSV